MVTPRECAHVCCHGPLTGPARHMPDQNSAAGPPARPEQTIAGARAPVRDARLRVLRGRPPHHGLLRQKLRREVRHRTSIQCAPLRRRICVSGVDVSTARSSRSTTLHLAPCTARRYRHDNDGALLEITDGLEITPKVPLQRDCILSHRSTQIPVGTGAGTGPAPFGADRLWSVFACRPFGRRAHPRPPRRAAQAARCVCARSDAAFVLPPIQSGLCV